MIIREQKWINLIFSFKVSILHVIWARLLILMVGTTIMTIIYYLINEHDYVPGLRVPTMDFLPISILGFVIALYLSFANNAAYDRWWEGRKLWGSLVNTTRSLARQSTVLIHNDLVEDNQEIESIKKDLIYKIIAFVYLFKNSLRHTNDNKREFDLYLKIDEINNLLFELNKPNAMLIMIEKNLAYAFKKKYINKYNYYIFEQSLVELTNIMGGCERINTTPLPFPYKVLLNRLVIIYCYLLPFSILPIVGIFSPLIILIMSYALIGLAALVDELAMPFGYETNDLPLDTICRTIEINLLQTLGLHDNLPNVIEADKFGILT